MGFVRRSFSASWVESRFAFTLAPSLVKSINLAKILTKKTQEVTKRLGSVLINALRGSYLYLSPGFNERIRLKPSGDSC